MTMKYRFNAEPAQPTFSLLPAGDYSFVVTECGDPVFKEDTKNWVLAVRLAVGPEKVPVFDNPWARSEQSEKQDGRDGIAQFLMAINMAPAAGKDPDWKGCIGKKGTCKIKIENDQNGTPRNKIAFYFAPKQAGGMSGQSVSAGEFQKARAAQAAKMQGGAQPEEDKLPY